MRIDIMDGTTVINTIVASQEFAEQHYPGAWRVAAVQDVPTGAQSPGVCSPAQGLVALDALKGISDSDISAAIAGISDPATRYTTQIAFSRATEWRRDSASFQSLAALLQLDEQDIDELFSFAVTVSV